MTFVRYALAIAFLAFGVWNSGAFDDAVVMGTKWIALTIVLYAVPLLGQLIPVVTIRILVLWFGVFLVLQTVATPMIGARSDSFIHLAPNQDYRIDIVDGAIPGIVGIQHVSTDELGFRVVPKVNYGDKSGLRIFAIGGSTTEEIYSDDEATWTHQLQENLKEMLGRKVEVINTGVAGLRAIHHLATLQEISKYSPDIVLFLIGVNDWNRALIDELEPAQDANFLPYFFGSLLGKYINDRYVTIVKRSSMSGGIFREHGDYFNRNRNSLFLPDRREYIPDRVSPAYAKELNDIAKECKSFGGLCVFVTQPHGYRAEATEEFKKSFWMTPPLRKYTLTFDGMAATANLYNQYLIDFAHQENIFVFDLASGMEASVHSFHDDVHFNTEGAANVARLVGEMLIEQVIPEIRARHGEHCSENGSENGSETYGVLFDSCVPVGHERLRSFVSRHSLHARSR